MKQFRWRILICVLPVLVAAILVGLAWTQYQEGKGGFKLGVDLAGGTILVYEVQDPDAKVDMNELAAALKRRIDPNDLYNVTIRPVGTGRVEIILPTGNRKQVQAQEAAWRGFLEKVAREWPAKGDRTYDDISRGDIAKLIKRIQENDDSVKTEDIDKFINENYKGGQERRGLTGEEVERIKELIARQGLLEFRILANERDDGPALEAARALFAEAKKDKALRETLEQLARGGKPPPPPRNAQGGNTFQAADGSTYSYTWVELGPDERYQLGLDNAAETDTDARRKGEWERAAAARKNGEPLTMLNGVLLYSRDFVVPPANVAPANREKKVEYFFLTRDPEPGKAVTGDYLIDARGDVDEKLQPMVRFRFNATGGDLFHDLTTRNKPVGEHYRHLAIVLDNQIMSAPRIQSPIRTEGSITNMSSSREVDALVTILKAGKLPATLKQKPVAENTIGATLGEDTIRSGTYSALLAFLAILIFMIIYYRFAGLVACIALVANLLLTVAFMVMVKATFTLAGMAGLVLMLGMAVDANILIYERFREERDRGASVALAIRNGYQRSFGTIIDTHLSSIFTAIVLFVVGNDQLKGFAISLTVGLIISLFTSLYMTRLIFDIGLARGWLKELRMFRLFARPNIDFMGVRHYWFTASMVLTIAGTILFLVRGKEGLNIDFNGGTAYGGQLVKPVDIGTLREQLSEARQKEKLAVQSVKQLDSAGYSFQITYQDGATRKVLVPQAMTEAEVARHASELPDLSIQLDFISTPGYSEGSRSKLFTVRTIERSPELVMAAVDRLLGDLQRKVELRAGDIDPTGRRVDLRFVELGTDTPAFASPAQVTRVLEREFQTQGMPLQSGRFTVTGEGPEEEGRYSQMRLDLSAAVDKDQLARVLKQAQEEFKASPQPERLENFDSQLAGETQARALYAILASWAAILLYVWFRFGNWTFGLAAVICLVHDVLFTLGVLALCHYVHAYVPALANVLLLQDFKIDLPTVAALLTLVGYSINDKIVVYDRMREVRGKKPELTPQIINDSLNQALSRTVLTGLSVLLVLLVLYIFGGEGIHLFAFVMLIGMIVGTYSSIYVASPLLLLFGEGKQAGPRAQPSQPVSTTV